MKTLTITLPLLALLGQRVYAQQTPSHPLIAQAEYDRWQTELSNWGRWGKDDELGTLNLITPAKRKQARGVGKGGRSRYPWPAMPAPLRRSTTLALSNGS